MEKKIVVHGRKASAELAVTWMTASRAPALEADNPPT